MSALDVLVAAGLLLGSALALVAAIGLHRLPDVFCRMHAQTKPVTLGMVLTLGAVMLHLRGSEATTTLLLVIALQFLTAPAGAHMIGRAAYGTGRLLSPGTRIEPLRGEDG